jgi:SSS family solute:Na+ symporter
MRLHGLDLAILIAYFALMLIVGVLAERRASQGLSSYFLGGRRLPFWLLSLSNAASMFDISGTMWLVTLLFVYGLKSVFIPWLWPVFNQIFLMVYLSRWLRRSRAVTGGEWIALRFGRDRGAELARLAVVGFALASVIGFTSYAFIGIVKFAGVFLPSGPGRLSPMGYGLLIVAVTTTYTVLGGLFSVVLTDLIQFVIMAVACVAIAAIAMARVPPELLAASVPAGWSEIGFGWRLGLDWSQLLPSLMPRIKADGYEIFGAFFLMMTAKGVLVSLAGPAPDYDMQRILASRSPREAAYMSGFVSIVLFFPRYLMIGGITLLALGFLRPHIAQLGPGADFETILPLVLRDFVPAGLAGLLLAGLLAAFMSTFSGTINAAAAYLVNDLYIRYRSSRPSEKSAVRVGRFASIAVVGLGCLFGYFAGSVASLVDWIVSALWGGYAAPNLLKWIWWRMNGYGYFFGMAAGLLGALLVAAFPAIPPLASFPLLLLISGAGSVAGSLLTAPPDEGVLREFYVRTRPWGAWGAVHAAAAKKVPGLEKNRDLPRDAVNVLVGIVWQTALVALPLYLVTRAWTSLLTCASVIAAASWFLKVSWLDRLAADGVDRESEGAT